jgi:hypothetical protein
MEEHQIKRPLATWVQPAVTLLVAVEARQTNTRLQQQIPKAARLPAAFQRLNRID